MISFEGSNAKGYKGHEVAWPNVKLYLYDC